MIYNWVIREILCLVLEWYALDQSWFTLSHKESTSKSVIRYAWSWEDYVLDSKLGTLDHERITT
jgi:hypothetical protein